MVDCEQRRIDWPDCLEGKNEIAGLLGVYGASPYELSNTSILSQSGPSG